MFIFYILIIKMAQDLTPRLNRKSIFWRNTYNHGQVRIHVCHIKGEFTVALNRWQHLNYWYILAIQHVLMLETFIFLANVSLLASRRREQNQISKQCTEGGLNALKLQLSGLFSKQQLRSDTKDNPVIINDLSLI